jgi:hypothetical protein
VRKGIVWYRRQVGEAYSPAEKKSIRLCDWFGTSSSAVYFFLQKGTWQVVSVRSCLRFVSALLFFKKSNKMQVAHAHWPLAPRRKSKTKKKTAGNGPTFVIIENDQFKV